MSLLSFSLLFLFTFNAGAVVPPSETFRFVNDGEFGSFVVEYGGDYRVISIGTAPFQLAFYNTTPNAFTLALRMATTRSESLFRWVWEANRGNPVRENATFSLGTDGNLVLADADGRIAWQSNTANKGVVGFKLSPNGNMVLHDASGKFIWQSFDHPTDTLLVGQSLRAGGATKLVSRASAQNNVDGAYSLVLEPKELTVTLNVEETNDGFAYDVLLDYTVANSSIGTGNLILTRPKYNSTLSFLRLGIDGNLRVFTYYYKMWELWALLGQPMRRLPIAERITWLKPELSTTEGQRIKENDCGRKCTTDCKCLGYFYHRETSKCWIANELKTLAKTSNTSHVGYIKAPNK
ncbi:Epidermis-specific secreted glycoprotein EP1 [Hibiscus syriacus]|uniref:Epidermis-specific secreted glycoprotein EP1 n=1 Tax=Hibiscus syriacus TaxID=106335 RepID=A0A6A3AHN7_HIBSY|nr:Epidermis-specific secreted glycoprotein EP1 [Hibiscus syriacus]